MLPRFGRGFVVVEEYVADTSRIDISLPCKACIVCIALTNSLRRGALDFAEIGRYTEQASR
jgi:hypothetical protein